MGVSVGWCWSMLGRRCRRFGFEKNAKAVVSCFEKLRQLLAQVTRAQKKGSKGGIRERGGGRVVAVVVVVVGAGSLFEACLPALPARGASNETSGARAVMPSGTYIHATYSFESILVSSPRLVSAPTTSYGPLTSSATPLVGSPMIPVPAQPSPAHPIPSRLSPPARA